MAKVMVPKPAHPPSRSRREKCDTPTTVWVAGMSHGPRATLFLLDARPSRRQYRLHTVLSTRVHE